MTAGAGPACLSSSLFDAIWPNGVVEPFSFISANRSHPLENCGMVGERYFFDSLFPPVDRFGTRKEKHYPGRFLGVQRARKRPGIKLLCHLSSRFRRGADDVGRIAIVHPKSVREVARGVDGKKSKKARRGAQ